MANKSFDSTISNDEESKNKLQTKFFVKFLMVNPKSIQHQTWKNLFLGVYYANSIMFNSP